MAGSSSMNRSYAPGSLAGAPRKFAGGVRRQGESRENFQNRMGYSREMMPGETRQGSLLDEHYARQNPNVLGGADPRFPGRSASEIAGQASQYGLRMGAGGSLTPNRNFSPREQQALGMGGSTREENVARAKQMGTFADIRRKFNRENPGQRMNMKGDIVARPQRGGGQQAPAGNLPPSPLMASMTRRQQMGAQAPAFDVTKPFTPDMVGASSPAAPRPPRPQSPIQSPMQTTAAPATPNYRGRMQEYLDRKSMERGMATGRVDTRDASGRLTGIQSKYGTATRDYNPPPAGIRAPAMTTDEFGKPETMTSYKERRKYIQGTKGMS